MSDCNVVNLASRRPQVVPVRSLPDLGMRTADIIAARVFADIRGTFAELNTGMFAVAVDIAKPLLEQAGVSLAAAMGEIDPEEIGDARAMMIEEFEAELRRLFDVPNADREPDGAA